MTAFRKGSTKTVFRTAKMRTSMNGVEPEKEADKEADKEAAERKQRMAVRCLSPRPRHSAACRSQESDSHRTSKCWFNRWSVVDHRSVDH